MSKYAKTLLALIGATVMLSALVGTASANKLSISNRNLRVSWAALEFIEPLGGIVRCPVTLEGSLHSTTLSKVINALIGYITRASIVNSACNNGNATILQETLPWHVQYNGFEGTLPNITVLKTKLIGSSFRVEGPFGTCLFTTTATQPAFGNFNRNTATRALTAAVASGSITSNEGCGPFGSRVTGRFGGTSGVPTLLGTTTVITVTLI